jgi:hypothetical protein
MATEKNESRCRSDSFLEDTGNKNQSNESGVVQSNLDYSGATKKTNPLEISLVKKLDYRILPTLWMMYFLNYVKGPLFTLMKRILMIY